MPPEADMSLEQALAEATVEVKMPETAAELAAARGDAIEAPEAPAKPEEPAPEERAEVEKVAEEVARPRNPDGTFAPKKEEAAPEAAETPAEEPEKAAPAKIPKARFDEMRTKLQARLEAAEKTIAQQAAALKGPETVQQAEAEIKARVKTYNGLLADGKLDEAEDVMVEINRLNRQIVAIEMAPKVLEREVAQTHARGLEATVELYKEQFPEFDESTDSFQQELVNEVAELQGAYEAAGYSPAVALQKAADMVVKANALRPLSDRGTPAPAKADKGADRKTAEVKKGIEAAGKQPPSLAKAGIDSDKAGAAKITAENLTYEMLRELPESTLKKLRGDLIA